MSQFWRHVSLLVLAAFFTVLFVRLGAYVMKEPLGAFNTSTLVFIGVGALMGLVMSLSKAIVKERYQVSVSALTALGAIVLLIIHLFSVSLFNASSDWEYGAFAVIIVAIWIALWGFSAYWVVRLFYSE